MSTSSQMDVNPTVESFVRGMDVRLHVFLTSFTRMTYPLQQSRLESVELKRQWQRIARGKRQILDPAVDIYFLEKKHILDFGLDDDFVQRFDLATFANEVFLSNPTVFHCKRGLMGFTRIFLPKTTNVGDNTSDPLKTIFRQLVILILGFLANPQPGIPSSKKITVQNVTDLCNTDVIPELELLSKTEVTSIVTLAARVANDDKQALSLFNKTLKLIRDQISLKLQSLRPVADQSKLEEYQLEREKYLSGLSPIESDLYESQSPNDPSAEESSGEDEQLSRPHLEDNDSMDIDHSEDTIPPVNGRSQSSAGSRRLQSVTQSANVAGKQRASGPAPIASEPNDSSPSQPSRRRRRDYLDDEDAYITDQDEAMVDPPKSGTEAESSKGKGKGKVASTAAAKQPSNPETRKPVPKVRRVTQHWSPQEEQRILQLVPQFLHAETSGSRIRRIKWSKLKEYDEENGNILRRRTQVMLKDKYRDLTDEGQHRALVNQINRARRATTEQQN